MLDQYKVEPYTEKELHALKVEFQTRKAAAEFFVKINTTPEVDQVGQLVGEDEGEYKEYFFGTHAECVAEAQKDAWHTDDSQRFALLVVSKSTRRVVEQFCSEYYEEL